MRPNSTTVPYRTYDLCACGRPKKRGAELCQPCRWDMNARDQQKRAEAIAPNLSGLCMCGCGESTPIATETDASKRMVKGQHRLYVGSHGKRKPGLPYAVNQATGCWEWQRGLNEHGYGTIGRDGRHQLAHRYFYEQKYGPIPEGLEPDHTCRNRKCVNPDHLEPVTHAENVRRGLAGQKRAFGPVCNQEVHAA